MQDRFKFRLYDKAIGEMVHDVCIGFIKDSGKTDDWVCADTSYGQITYRDDKLKDIVLMQCTGLKDKNGRLIYEGDICKYKFEEIGEQKAIIYFNKELCSFLAKPLNDFQYIKINDCEVIGNIYENPKLLEVENENN